MTHRYINTGGGGSASGSGMGAGWFNGNCRDTRTRGFTGGGTSLGYRHPGSSPRNYPDFSVIRPGSYPEDNADEEEGEPSLLDILSECGTFGSEASFGLQAGLNYQWGPAKASVDINALSYTVYADYKGRHRSGLDSGGAAKGGLGVAYGGMGAYPEGTKFSRTGELPHQLIGRDYEYDAGVKRPFSIPMKYELGFKLLFGGVISVGIDQQCLAKLKEK